MTTRRSFIQAACAAVAGVAMAVYCPVRVDAPRRKPRICSWTGAYSGDFTDGRNFRDGVVPDPEYGDTAMIGGPADRMPSNKELMRIGAVPISLRPA